MDEAALSPTPSACSKRKTGASGSSITKRKKEAYNAEDPGEETRRNPPKAMEKNEDEDEDDNKNGVTKSSWKPAHLNKGSEKN